jgi:hypothetical protein
MVDWSRLLATGGRLRSLKVKDGGMGTMRGLSKGLEAELNPVPCSTDGLDAAEGA